ncbi:MAG: hypothetical protein BWY38_03293 [Ignavibacteria bacterium ADurb.Bin266]|nr:MAG: hypothetical protein BWY38_03293 [Ignavibacteria bacterium ADurb.Bin266]
MNKKIISLATGFAAFCIFVELSIASDLDEILKMTVDEVYKSKDIVFYYNSILQSKKSPFRIIRRDDSEILAPVDNEDKDKYPGHAEIDRKNGFISILNGCQCHGTYEVITCFFDSSRRPFVMIGGTSHKGRSFEFLFPTRLSGWVNVREKCFPLVNCRDFLADLNVPVSDVVENIAEFSYEVPQNGTTVKVYINHFFLNEIITENPLTPENPDYNSSVEKYRNDKKVVKEVRFFLKSLKRNSIKLKWNADKSMFEKVIE